MNKFKFDAFKAEFPWLDDAVKTAQVSSDHIACNGISVKRITAELLAKTPSTYEADGSVVGVDEGDVCILVYSDHLQKVRSSGSCRSNWAHDDDSSWDGETVLETIDEHGVPDFIAWFEYGLDCVNHYSTHDWRATIYKAAKDVDVADLVAQAQVQALSQVQAEGAF